MLAICGSILLTFTVQIVPISKVQYKLTIYFLPRKRSLSFQHVAGDGCINTRLHEASLWDGV